MPPDFFHSEPPIVPRRGVHLDLKGQVPRYERLIELLDLFAALRFEIVLFEWEDCFPWSCDPRLRAKHAFTPAQIEGIAAACAERKLEIIPLVQSIGHSENVLRLPENEALREIPGRTDVFHPLNPQSPQLIAAMVEDVLQLLPQVKRFHLGGDEVYTLGEHPESGAFIRDHGIAALYLKQWTPAFQLLEDRGIRPMLWHDEIVQWESAQIERIANRADLVVWGYTDDPRKPETYHHREPHLQKLQQLGVTYGALPLTRVPTGRPPSGRARWSGPKQPRAGPR